MSENTKTEAIVLKSYKLKESDKILHLLTKEFGPVRAIAKGAFKLNSKHASNTQVLCKSQFMFAHGRNFEIIVESKLINAYTNIQSDLLILSSAYYLVEIIDKSLVHDNSHNEPYELLSETLQALNNIASKSDSSTKLLPILIKFLWNLTTLLGYKPELEELNTNTNTQIKTSDTKEKINQAQMLNFLNQHLQQNLHQEFKSWKILDNLLGEEFLENLSVPLR